MPRKPCTSQVYSGSCHDVQVAGVQVHGFLLPRKLTTPLVLTVLSMVCRRAVLCVPKASDPSAEASKVSAGLGG